jgi:hypothetical protein
VPDTAVIWSGYLLAARKHQREAPWKGPDPIFSIP